MFNRFMRVVVFFLSIILIIPALVLTPITYILFDYPICAAVMVIGANCVDGEDWNYKEIFDYV